SPAWAQLSLAGIFRSRALPAPPAPPQFDLRMQRLRDLGEVLRPGVLHKRLRDQPLEQRSGKRAKCDTTCGDDADDLDRSVEHHTTPLDGLIERFSRHAQDSTSVSTGFIPQRHSRADISNGLAADRC